MDTPRSGLATFGTLVIIALVALYLVVSFMGMAETQDAKLVDQTQIVLQDALERGVTLLGISAQKIHPANLVNASRSSLPKGVRLDTSLHLTIPKSGRQAWFTVDDSGQVVLSNLKHFSRYHVAQGHITRNNHWSLPFSDARLTKSHE